MFIADDKPGTAENYSTAISASNLRCEPDRGGAADSLIAVGWSSSRLGASLMRLQSEWDCSSKPAKPKAEAIKALATTLPRLEPSKTLDMRAAYERASEWHRHELGLLLQRLKTLPEVRLQMTIWARKAMIADAQHRAAEIILWHLDHTCEPCGGLGKIKIPGTPSLSHKDCKACHGSRQRPVPASDEQQRYRRESLIMLKHIDVCVKTAKTNLSHRLHGMRTKKHQ